MSHSTTVLCTDRQRKRERERERERGKEIFRQRKGSSVYPKSARYPKEGNVSVINRGLSNGIKTDICSTIFARNIRREGLIIIFSLI